MGEKKYIHLKCLEEWVKYWPDFMDSPRAATYYQRCPHCKDMIILQMVEGATSCKSVSDMGQTIMSNIKKQCWLWILGILILALFIFNTQSLLTMNHRIVEENFILYAMCIIIEGIIACIVLRWVWIIITTLLMERKLRIGKIFPPRLIERYE
jgi:hypothetical protein